MMGYDTDIEYDNSMSDSGRSDLMDDVVKRAGKLIGADDLKEYIERSAALYKHAGENSSVILAAVSRMYLLSVNSGDGVRTQVGLIADMLRAMGNVDDLPVRYFTLKLPDTAFRPVDVNLKTDRDIVLADIESMGLLNISQRRLCCIDISAWIERVESAEFRAVLARLRDHMYDQFVVFWIPAVDEITIRRVREAIGWYVNVDDIYTPPYSVDEYFEFGMNRLAKMDLRLDDDAMDLFRDCIVDCRGYNTFWGFNTVKNLIDEMIFTSLMEREGSYVL